MIEPEKITVSCGTTAMRSRTSCGTAFFTSTPSTVTRALLRIEEALGQGEDGGLAGARGPDDGHRLARLHAERDIDERILLGARGIGEGDVLERQAALRRPRQRLGHGGRGDDGLFVEQFRDALGRAGGELHLAPDLRELAHRGGGEDRIDQELAERAGRHGAGDDGAGAVPQQDHDGAGGNADDEGGEHGAREGALGGSAEGRRWWHR